MSATTDKYKMLGYGLYEHYNSFIAISKEKDKFVIYGGLGEKIERNIPKNTTYMCNIASCVVTLKILNTHNEENYSIDSFGNIVKSADLTRIFIAENDNYWASYKLLKSIVQSKGIAGESEIQLFNKRTKKKYSYKGDGSKAYAGLTEFSNGNLLIGGVHYIDTSTQKCYSFNEMLSQSGYVICCDYAKLGTKNIKCIIDKENGNLYGVYEKIINGPIARCKTYLICGTEDQRKRLAGVDVLMQNTTPCNFDKSKTIWEFTQL